MVKVSKVLDDEKGISMIDKMLIKHSDQLPEGKTIKDFGGGYVEILKTKAKVVLYFGFTSSNNRVQIKFEIAKSDVLRWQNAIAQKMWNKEEEDSSIERFEDEPNDNEPIENIVPVLVKEYEDSVKNKDDDIPAFCQ